MSLSLSDLFASLVVVVVCYILNWPFSVKREMNRNNNADAYFPPPPIVDVIAADDLSFATEASTLEEAIGDAVPPEEEVVVMNRPTPRAQLGKEILKRLKEGKPVSDRQMAKLVALKLQQLPPDSGWLLLGFPRTRGQVRASLVCVCGCLWGCVCVCVCARVCVRDKKIFSISLRPFGFLNSRPGSFVSIRHLLDLLRSYRLWTGRFITTNGGRCRSTPLRWSTTPSPLSRTKSPETNNNNNNNNNSHL